MTQNKPLNHSKIYTLVWVALLLLTGVTVYVAQIDFGVLNVLIAILIASVKAALVALFFMHLKYDNNVNRVVFVSSFVFLAIFVGLTWSDLFGRPSVSPAPVQAVEPPASTQEAKMAKLLEPTPELVAKGKEAYQANCVTCHGESGAGDGPAAAAFNPKPRDFTQGNDWKQGRSPAQVFHTVTKGVGSMPAFSALSVENRWAVTHYILSLGPTPPPDTPETLALIGLTPGGEQAAEKEITPELPVEFMIDRMAR